MANNPNTPYGLQPIQNRGSADYRGNLQVYFVPASTTNALFLGDPVIKGTVGSTNTGFAYESVNLVTAASNNKITGVIVGLLGSNPNGAFFANSGTPGPLYKATNSATAQYVLVDNSTETLWTVQCTGTPATTIVGKNVGLISGQGGKYTGWSGWQCSATATNSATAQLQVMGFVNDPSNVIGNKFPKLIVRINQSTETVGAAGI